VPILEANAGASGLAFVGAAAFGDEAWLRALLTSVNLAAFPVREGDGLRLADLVQDQRLTAPPTEEPLMEAPPKVLAAPPVTAGPPAVPVKSGRPSSRLAQLTVPSMAQSVASTAAKSSFGPSGDVEPLTPVIPAVIKKDSKLANNWKTKKPDQLSDAELMAMSDNEYMNDTQMAFFRLKLVALKQGILANAGETTEHLREDTVVVPDPADRATIEEEHALELRTRDRERKLLKKIEQSIQRIDSGDYGYCDETGEPIGVGRLLARPTANLSLEAQQRRELKQKMFGD
jgi:DnaK suppressor protein